MMIWFSIWLFIRAQLCLTGSSSRWVRLERQLERKQPPQISWCTGMLGGSLLVSEGPAPAAPRPPHPSWAILACLASQGKADSILDSEHPHGQSMYLSLLSFLPKGPKGTSSVYEVTLQRPELCGVPAQEWPPRTVPRVGSTSSR